jgi:F420-non-reducing hydrogenase large subunit
MSEDDRKELMAGVQEAKEFALFTIKFAKENVFPKYLDVP